MVRISEDDLRAQVLEIAVRDGLDGALRPNGHERRRLHHAMRRAHLTPPGGAIAREDVELKGLLNHHVNRIASTPVSFAS